MLSHLRVTNFALLSDVAIDFEDGFNVLTGETGAGKSLVVEAVNLLRGGRASADIPRQGASEAVVEAIFDIAADKLPLFEAMLAEAGLPDSGSELVVRRVIHKGGRSRTYVNGALTTAKNLAAIGEHLLDLSGQHQHQALAKISNHRVIVDMHGALLEKLHKLEEAVAVWKHAEKQLEAVRTQDDSRIEQLDFLKFQLSEIEAANLKPGEEHELVQKRNKLRNADKLALHTSAAEHILYSAESSIVDQLGNATKHVSELAAIEPSLESAVAQCQEAQVLVEEAARAIQDFSSDLEADPEALDSVEARLDLIARLRRRHGKDVEGILGDAAAMTDTIANLENHDKRLAALEREVETSYNAAIKMARTLRSARKKTATQITDKVNIALADLGMTSASIEIDFAESPLTATGIDKIEILLASNAGEPAKALSKVASGGELSRIMLALKLILKNAVAVSSYVFDEVDAGISGQTAQVVGRHIKEVASGTQVVCITHLPQIAAYADAHFNVAKHEEAGRTETLVTRLNQSEHTDEVARMLSGKALTKAARANAKQLIAEATAR